MSEVAKEKGMSYPTRFPKVDLKNVAKKSAAQNALYDKEALKVLAGGKISEVFGKIFEEQDQYDIQVRMPMLPLLLADRVMSIEGEPLSMTNGKIVTETDVEEDSWYLSNGHIPAGLMVEAGQADLLLASWLGIDFSNKGVKKYRLLGCDLSFHGPLAVPGETLRYEIIVDGFSQLGDTYLMFFHYDAYVGDERRMSVRSGQAGFFSEDELAQSKGVIFNPQMHKYTEAAKLDRGPCITTYRQFKKEQLVDFGKGEGYRCFGPGFERLQTMNMAPRIQADKMLFMEEVTDFDPTGGPAKRGYMRAVQEVAPDDWFFEGHFRNDPCMPGTLMAEGGMQLTSFYLAALGFTIGRDGWVFEPVYDHMSKMKCRGQCDPGSKQVVYELFVDEVIEDPYPTIYVELLATVDGLKAFHANRFSVRLVPQWPMYRNMELLKEHKYAGKVAEDMGLKYDFRAMLAAAWGRPTDAFTHMGEFPKHYNIPRLPGPPYLLMSRVVEIEGEVNSMKAGIELVAEYDVPEYAWYFDENDRAVMPYGVLMEIGLQPCGWLASYAGCSVVAGKECFFRNLDGVGTMYKDITPGAGVLRTESKLIKLSPLGEMILVEFEVKVSLGDELVYEMKTGFGFFPKAALENQKGLPITDEDKRWREVASNQAIKLRERPEKHCGGKLALADNMLLMLEDVEYLAEAPAEGVIAGLRASKQVNPAEWFFKAHFMNDPVQPGSLGVQAIYQLLQFYMIDAGLGDKYKQPGFEAAGLSEALTWKYRGQVVPENKKIEITMLVKDVVDEGESTVARADASYWIDGKRVYECENVAVRVKEVVHG